MNWLTIWRWTLDFLWLLALLYVFRHFWQKRANLLIAQHWLQTKGRVTACEWTQVGHSVWPKIEYTYQIGEHELVGEYLFLDTAHNNPNSKYARGIAYKVAVAFKQGDEIEVYYNPNDPTQSALDVSMPHKLNFILILIGVIIFIQVSLMVLRWWQVVD
ncbi:MAG: hypothetical protein BGO90_12765 [Legionella sp. 40-6]|nr:DUF3592 domain-containing protein [Legionella sp.]OJY40148.1 MAG: hypothetical protein BGO90_12765 [Legionella sp. 40-6]